MIRFSRLSILAILLLFQSTIAIADTRKENLERQKTEWTKFQDEIENLCIGSGEAWFSYAPLDRLHFHPVHFNPQLPMDLMKRVSGSLKLKDPRITESLEGPFNDAVNARIEALRSGRFNNINVVVAKGVGVTITPAAHQSEDLVIWLPRSFLDRLGDLSEGNRPHDTLYLLTASGSLQPLDSKSQPSWLQSRNLNDYLWSHSGSDRHRLQKMTRCTYQALPK